ncbi:hypothetical protein V497_01651 [Pseudogymnoascus sp. VKM F-4516 (FW-969)]|nr:hypothetical protein V497_01651 [Pseudogymnoascus sp. VKM F-4516 (FW-969)]
MDHLPTGLTRTVPAHFIHAPRRAALLDHDADCVGEADGVVGDVGGEEEHGAFGYGEGAGGAVVDDLQEEGAAVLVEPFGGGVDVVVCAGVGAADDLVGRRG